MYWSNLFVWFSNSKCSLWDKITVAGWESVVCRVFCVACPVFILLRHRDFIFDTLMTSIHSETLGSISFSYVCVWLTVGSMCVCGVSLRLLKKNCSALLESFWNTLYNWNILYKQFFNRIISSVDNQVYMQKVGLRLWKIVMWWDSRRDESCSLRIIPIIIKFKSYLSTECNLSCYQMQIL